MADIHSDDYYKVLGIQQTASDADIAKAYKKLALKHHPDKNPDRKEQAEEDFKKITEAYEALRNPEKRKEYDLYGKAGSHGDRQPRDEGQFHFNAGGPGASRMSRAEADEIFRTFFGGRDPFGSMFGDDLFGEDGGSGSGPFVFHRANPHGAGHHSNDPFSDIGFASFGDRAFPRGFSSHMGSFGSRPAGGRGQAPRSAHQPQNGRARSRQQHRMPRYAVPQGTTVLVQGLTKSPQHNHKLAEVSAWNGEKQRYQVQLQTEGGDKLWLRPQNVTQLCTVEVTGLASKHELNGKSGDIFNYDEVKGRYMVLLNGQDAAVSLQPGNCVLQAGTRVVVRGLQNPECNGQMAQITSIDRDAARYTVKCQNGKQIKIKYNNALC